LQIRHIHHGHHSPQQKFQKWSRKVKSNIFSNFINPINSVNMSFEQSATAVYEALQTNDSRQVREAFELSFNSLTESFVSHIATEYGLPGEPAERVKKLLEYTCIGGKYNRGLLILSGVVDLHALENRKGADVPKQHIEASLVLAWCVEILQSFFLVADDVMDHSLTRRGRPCWYKLPEVGLDAVNDSLILESFLFFLIEKFCSGNSWYLNVVSLFRDVSRVWICQCF
jgi:farnesyl diphosphate synthase